VVSLRLALAQTNPIVGDLVGNADQVLEAARAAAAAGAQVVATGEMALSGYPIEDLAAQPAFLRAAAEAVETLAARLAAAGLGELVVVVGHPDGPHPASPDGRNAPVAIAQNCASVLHRGRVIHRAVKHHLPNYGVFDEYRTFIPGDELTTFDVALADSASEPARARVALIICEDLWLDAGPVADARGAGADLLLVLNASPFERDKDDLRLPLAARRAAELAVPVAYVNLVGGQDDLVFDGDSFVMDVDGSLLARAPRFREDLLLAEIRIPPAPEDEATNAACTGADHPALVADDDDLEQVWGALVLGLRDYVEKNGFGSVILGLSGGIDSAVCAAIAVDAIGGDRVYGVSMPSRWSSEHSRSDADDLAERLGLHYSTEPIADLVAPFETQLGLEGVAAENVQARARGVILMAKSNQAGHLVLTTGNKSELSVGYSTIYGDSVGGFAPIKDVPKTLVWALARWRNAAAAVRGQTPPIPEASITKPPSAELRPDQVDQDSLPPYELLDAILDGYVGRRLGRADLVAAGFDAATVERVADLVDRAEWKRRQGAIGPKISGMAFGRDRRLPITVRRTP